MTQNCKVIMRRIELTFFILLGTAITLKAAVPKKVMNACKALATVITYGNDGKMISTSVAFSIGEKGEAVSEYAAFNNARSAEYVSETSGRQKVKRINGASDIYDVIKFSTEEKPKVSLAVANSVCQRGTLVYVLRKGNSKKSEAVACKIKSIKEVPGGVYYELSLPYDEKSVGCPVVNESGECLAVVQRNVGKDATTYAISASFCGNMKVRETDYGNPALNSVLIPKALPDGENAAYTYVYMLSQVNHDKDVYIAALQDFVNEYPNNADGYIERAKFKASQYKFKECEADIAKAVSLSNKKDNPHYVLSRLIYQSALYNSTKAASEGWTLEKSASEAQEAYNINPLPLYQLQLGDCYFGMKRYSEAVNMYSAVNSSSIATPETYFYEAKARGKVDSLDAKIIVLLDSAISCFPKPYSNNVAPYIFERANQYNKMGKYRESTIDYLEYEHIVGFQNLNDNFYYIREQIALKGKMYKQADDDINRALAINPNDYVYNAEKAALMLRFGMFEEAVHSALRAIKIDPKATDGYRLLGIAYGEMKKKQLCLQNLKKAKDLGDDRADELIKQYK